MLTQNKSQVPVKALLLVSMVVKGENREAGEVVELPAREFNYLAQFDRVVVATTENVSALKAKLADERKAAKEASAYVDELTATKAQLAAVQAENAALKKGK